MKPTNEAPPSNGVAALERPRRQRGMTLIEIMIVLAIIALVMGLLVGPAVIRKWQVAQTKTAYAMTRRISTAWTQWQVDSGGTCPTIENLKPDLGLEPSQSVKDPWGETYVLACDACSSGICVLSKGRDNELGTDDDIKGWEDAPR